MFSATFPRQMEALARKILTKPIEVKKLFSSYEWTKLKEKKSLTEVRVRFVFNQLAEKWKPIVTYIRCVSPALAACCLFSRVWQGLHVFPRLVRVTGFLSLVTGYMSSRAFCLLRVFPCLLPYACFPWLFVFIQRYCSFNQVLNVFFKLGLFFFCSRYKLVVGVSFAQMYNKTWYVLEFESVLFSVFVFFQRENGVEEGYTIR